MHENFYHKVIGAECSGNFKLKTGVVKRRDYGVFVLTRIIVLKLLSTKSLVKKREEF